MLTARLVERGKTSKRTDDTPEAIERRLRTYTVQAAPMLERLRDRGVISRVDASQPVDDVFTSACEAYNKVSAG